MGSARSAAVLVLLAVSGSCSCWSFGSCSTVHRDDCRWRVVAERPARPAEVPFDDTKPLLREPQDGNAIPGPGALRVLVKPDSLHHPQLYLEDGRSGRVRHLLSGSQPKWSPDGTRIACCAWRSRERPWMLCVVDVASGRTFEPDIGVAVMTFRWAPDGRAIAVNGVRYGRAVNALCLVNLPSGESRILDTLAVFSDYEFGWSPDSRTLAAVRPTDVSPDEEVARSELWLFDIAGRKCRIVGTREYIERNPRWIDTARLQFDRVSAGGGGGAMLRTVVELARR